VSDDAGDTATTTPRARRGGPSIGTKTTGGGDGGEGLVVLVVVVVVVVLEGRGEEMAVMSGVLKPYDKRTR